MNKKLKIVLVLVAVVCFGVALWYPIDQYMQEKQNLETMDMLTSMRDAGKQGAATETPAVSDSPEEAADEPTPEPADEQPGADVNQPEAQPAAADAEHPVSPTQQPAAPTAAPMAAQTVGTQPVATVPAGTDAIGSTAAVETPAPTATPTPTPEPTPSPSPSPTPDRRVYTGPLSWPQIEKVALDEDKILPQYRELYELNGDMVGWLTIVDTRIDYPVMQSADNTYYLNHDFLHNENENGLLILDNKCDPYTPSYHQVVSGHNRKNNLMFSNLYSYYDIKYNWNRHKFIQYDSLMEERTYVVFAAFYSADYDVDEEGFRYNADLQYSVDVEQWLKEIDAAKLYDTGIDVQFGDEFLTLTTCNNNRRRNGRFVVVCRRVREGETFE